MSTMEMLKDHVAEEDAELWAAVQRDIRCDRDVMDGLPVFAGTRVPVYIVLENLAEGVPEKEILAAYPTLEARHIRVALQFSRLLATLH